MPKRSAGILLYRHTDGRLELLLAHPGGPFFARKDAGVWSIPKGEYAPDEDALDAAKREFREELGMEPPDGDYQPLGDVKQKSGKIVTAFALEASVEIAAVRPGTFEMEWPLRSGRMESFPEVDRAEWFPADVAREKILPAQAAFIERLDAMIRAKP